MLDRSNNKSSVKINPLLNVECDICSNIINCISAGLNSTQMEDFCALKVRQRTYKACDYIYRMENDFKYFYIVKSGSVKVERIATNGEKFVVGFYYAGELLAIESIGTNVYGSDCIAMESAIICKIPYQAFLRFSSSVPGLQQNFTNLLAQRIRISNLSHMRRCSLPATWRLLYFLYDFAHRRCLLHKAKKNVDICLPMSKSDIANHLGITPESLSRTLASLEHDSYIQREQHNIKLLNVNEVWRDINERI